MANIRTRIAPSPTGDPHIGTAYIGLFNKVFAHQNSGQFLLRIEDTDRSRYSETSEKAIFAAMDWLSLTPDEGPHVGGEFGPYVQSQRLDIYKKYAKELIEGGHAYYCFCDKDRLQDMRKKQEKDGSDYKYDRCCLKLSQEEIEEKLANNIPYVIRMLVPSEGETVFTDLVRTDVKFENNLIDDQVLLKADGYPTYHLASIVDDHLMGITHVIRAEEWISSTPKHIMLYNMFGWSAPIFAHLPLLRNTDKSKISKRFNHTSLDWYKQEGFLPEALLNFLALLGWSHPEGKEIFSFDELKEQFSFSRFNTNAPVFDIEKLRWMNGTYIRNLSIDELFPKVEPFLIEAGFINANSSKEDIAFAKSAVLLEQEKVATLKEFIDRLVFMFNDGFDFSEEAESKWLHSGNPVVKESLLKLKEKIIEFDGEPVSEKYEEMIRAVAEELEIGAGKVIHPTRAAISGATKGPSLFHMMELFGKERLLKRLERGISHITE